MISGEEYGRFINFHLIIHIRLCNNVVYAGELSIVCLKVTCHGFIYEIYLFSSCSASICLFLMHFLRTDSSSFFLTAFLSQIMRNGLNIQFVTLFFSLNYITP